MATEPSITNESDTEEEITTMKFDIVGHLPIEIAQKILFQLPSEDLQSAISCCLSWKAAVSNDYLWKELCKREGYLEVDHLERKSEFYTNFLERYNYWQGVYWYNYTLQRNWETNNYSEVVYLIEDPNYRSETRLFDDVFVYAYQDQLKLNVYDFNTISLDKQVKPYVLPLDDYFFSNGYVSKSGKYLIVFSDHSTLTVWNLENGSKIQHEHNAYYYYVYKNLIALPILPEKFEVFNIETEQIEYCYHFEPDKMSYNMWFRDGRIVFSTLDDVIHILKWDDKSLVSIKCCNETDIVDLHQSVIQNDMLLSFCHKKQGFNNHNQFLCVWNTTTMTKLYSTYFDHDVESVPFRNKHNLLCLSNYVNNFDDTTPTINKIVLWDYIKRTEEVTVVTENKSSTPKVFISNDHVMILSDVSVLKMWCLSTRDFICDLNFIPHNYTYFDIKISKTKLICAISLTETNHYKLIVRNYEI